MARNYEVYYKGDAFESMTVLAKAMGISFTALKKNTTLTDDREVVLRDGLTDLRKLKRVAKKKAGIDFETFRYDDRSFSGYKELSSYIGIPGVAFRDRNFTNASFLKFVVKYREESYPFLVRGVRYASLFAITKAFDIPKGSFAGIELTDEVIEKRLSEVLAQELAREKANANTVLYDGEYYEHIMDISLKFNLDIRELLTAQRCGEPLESVTKKGRWGLKTEYGVDLTPRKFYEYQAERVDQEM